MPIIRVTPSILRDSANDLGHTRADSARLGLDVLSAGAGAPSYDGQFGPSVRDMAAEAHARAQAFAARLGEYSGRLANKAEAFELADLAGVAGLRPIGLPASWRERLQLLQQLARWLGLPTGLIELYLRLGLLAAFGLLAPHLISAMVIRSGFQIGWHGRTFVGSVFAAGLRAFFQRWLSGWANRGTITNPKPPSVVDPEPTGPVDTKPGVVHPKRPEADRKPLAVAKPEKFDSCALYAQARRPDLGRAGGQDGGAANYIGNYRDVAFQVTDSDTDLSARLTTGDAIVWDRGHESLSAEGLKYGHVAIVERVEGDRVWVSQANWAGKLEMEMTRDELKKLWVIPY